MIHSLVAKGALAAAVLALLLPVLVAQDVVNSPYVGTSAAGTVHIYPTPALTQQIKAQQASSPAAGVLTYHGGPLMTGNNFYAIFWIPAKLQNGQATTLTAKYQAVAKQMLADYPYHGISNNSTQYYSTKAGINTYFAGIAGSSPPWWTPIPIPPAAAMTL